MPLDDTHDFIPDDTEWGGDPFDICALLEEEQGEPIRRPAVKHT